MFDHDQELEKRHHPENFEPEYTCSACGVNIDTGEDVCDECAKKIYK